MCSTPDEAKTSENNGPETKKARYTWDDIFVTLLGIYVIAVGVWLLFESFVVAYTATYSGKG